MPTNWIGFTVLLHAHPMVRRVSTGCIVANESPMRLEMTRNIHFALDVPIQRPNRSAQHICWMRPSGIIMPVFSEADRAEQ